MNVNEIRAKMENFVSGLKVEEPKKEKKPKKLPEKQAKHAKYFEGELQLRNINKGILNYVINKVRSANENIPDIKEFSNNDVNLKMSSKKLAHQLGLELRKKFGGELKESEQLFSQNHQTGKEIFRLNVFFKKFDINIGDYFESANEAYKVRGFDKDKLKAENVNTKKRTQIKVANANQIPVKKCQVVQIEPCIYVLDDNYQNIEVVNAKNLKINQKIKCVFLNGNAYLC